MIMFHVEHYPEDKALSAKSKAAGRNARATQEVYPPSPWSSGIINLPRFCPQNIQVKGVAGKIQKGKDLLTVEPILYDKCQRTGISLRDCRES